MILENKTSYRYDKCPQLGLIHLVREVRISAHILSESSKDNTQIPNQTRYQLNSHLQSNTLELDDKAQTLGI
jgi:hypothetical protein